MRAARTLIGRLRLPEYRAQYDKFADEVGAIDAADDEVLLERQLLPDPARARVRVYSTQSTHKTLTSLRQGSMIHVTDQDFSQKAEETFHEAYMTHTSTSPNYQILASLDLAAGPAGPQPEQGIIGSSGAGVGLFDGTRAGVPFPLSGPAISLAISAAPN